MNDDLEHGRAAFARGEWGTAFERLSAADSIAPLAIEPLEELATAAYLIGKGISLLERAHSDAIRARDVARAARVAFWIVVDLLTKGESARGNGWLARLRRLLEDSPAECTERGLLLVLESRVQLIAGDVASAHESASTAVMLANRCADGTLDVFSRLALAQVRTVRSERAHAASLLDEIMVATTLGDVPPIAAGIVYCAVLDACHRLYDFPRAREWTLAFTRWCAAQRDLVPFRGQCMLHRIEIMRFAGEWALARTEAVRTCEWLAQEDDESETPTARALRSFRFPTGAAYYQLADIQRLRGEFTGAEAAYRKASAHGYSPEPGLSLLRLAQGRTRLAASAIRRALEAKESSGGPRDAYLLAAAVEILIAAGSIADAAAACEAMVSLSDTGDAEFLRALRSECKGRVLLARDDIRDAVHELNAAWTVWQELEAPYDAARVRVLLARAYLRRGDADAAELELDAAGRVFRRLEAKYDLAQLAEFVPARRAPGVSLTPREREVLRMLAAGRTNRTIGRALHISERTVDRHVSNILTKLSVTSRVAATAFAYEHGLVGERIF